MKALAIDTSNLVMGIAIIDNDQVIGEYITNLKKNHSIRLMPAIQQVMAEVNVLPKDLDRIIVAEGPGSYTGVRIGVTVAKTMAWSLKVPIVGVSSLEVLAQNGRFFNGAICPLFDARRGRVFTGLYESKQGAITRVMEDRNVSLEEWLKNLIDRQILFLGNDVNIHSQTIKKLLGDYAVFPSISINNPRPSELGLIGIKKEPQEVHGFVPNYLRLVEAEAKWIAMQKTQE